MNNALPGLSVAMSIVGLAWGFAYFAALRRAIGLLVSGRGWLLVSALTGARFAAIAILFTLAARLGALPLLGSLLGFFLAQKIALRAAWRGC
jgi:hypothetical protein